MNREVDLPRRWSSLPVTALATTIVLLIAGTILALYIDRSNER